MKDPAFLFYSDNFQSGTQFMTDEQTGKYIRLLCAQHLHGHLEEKHMIIICKTYDKDIWEKFTKDADGKYYNSRLEVEILKRKRYSESRAANREGKLKKKRKKICKTYDNHMGNGNEIDISFVNDNSRPIFMKWLNYKKARKESYKSQASLIECYEKLKKISGGKVKTAEAIINQSMANNWAGLFELKEPIKQNFAPILLQGTE